MRTIKFLSFVSACLLVLSSCDALADATTQEIKGTAPAIEFTTTAPVVASVSKVASATNLDPVIYETTQSIDFVKAELTKNSLSMDNMTGMEVTDVLFYMPDGGNISDFKGVKMYIDDVLIAEENAEGTAAYYIQFGFIKLSIKTPSILESIKGKESIKITIRNPKVPSVATKIKMTYDYLSKIQLIKLD